MCAKATVGNWRRGREGGVKEEAGKPAWGRKLLLLDWKQERQHSAGQTTDDDSVATAYEHVGTISRRGDVSSLLFLALDFQISRQ
jgi:hypothetical protein